MGAKGVLTAGRVLRHLADIEKMGYRFYSKLEECTPSEKVRSLAHMMKKAEQRHHQRFLEYAQRADAALDEGDMAYQLSLPPEVQRLLDADVFVDVGRLERAAQYAGDAEMFKVAIRAEENLALLLSQLRIYVPQKQRPFIDRVIREEWNHKAKLEENLVKHVK